MLTRRAFIEGFVAAVATVAIATRVAPKFLPESLRGGTWKYEQATEKYFYGIDIAKPWDVHLFEQTDFHDPESWKLMDVKELMQRAVGELVETEKQIQIGPRQDKPDRLFVCNEDERWPWNNVNEISHETLVEVGVDTDNDEAMQACSIIAMSQGFAALNVVGPGPVHWPDDHYDNGMDDVLRVPEISTTKEELFRHA